MAAMQATLKRLEAELLKEKKARQDLQCDMESQATQQAQATDDNGQGQVARMEEELNQEHIVNAKLQKQLDDMVKSSGTSTDTEGPTISRPKGTAGTHFSIQVAMKLASSQEKDLKYKAIQLTWSKIPALAKANLYSAAREKHKYLKCFENDWATEELAKMYFKNLRGNHYHQGYLQVPDGYSHFKANSAQHNQSAPCIKRAKAVMLKHQEARAQKDASKHQQEAEEEPDIEKDSMGQQPEEMQVDRENNEDHGEGASAAGDQDSESHGGDKE
ncbi:hypothetical protein ARMSODRAFT_970661 [Armillaria solidipes]|uniref:Uncharacterized protein n=1 Tax=Armillaria solidipes TaxID=1076256 RepID=A0A2H3C5Q9_9AGAR|nr:hypothetical protein ARMSODRAFT_970661 [Armillaria solidipes]